MAVAAFAGLLAAACASAEPADVVDDAGVHRLFGATEQLSDTIGNEITSSGVVAMRCIPSRSDPVGVLLGLEIVDWTLGEAELSVSLNTTYAKLGSHPSGCSDPSILIGDSMFLLGPDDETLHAASAVESDGTTTLVFDLGGRLAEDWTAVLLPTIEYALGNGDRQTSIYGLVGHYALM